MGPVSLSIVHIQTSLFQKHHQWRLSPCDSPLTSFAMNHAGETPLMMPLREQKTSDVKQLEREDC